jgi:hypothetical protein
VFDTLSIFHHQQLQFSVRLALAQRDRVWTFLDDTGSDYPSIYQRDLNILMADGGSILNQGTLNIMTANGITTFRTVDILITLAHQFPGVANPVVQTKAIIHPGEYNHGVSPLRMSGLWMRRFFYTGTAPDGNSTLLIANNKTGITSHMPTLQLPGPPHRFMT